MPLLSYLEDGLVLEYLHFSEFLLILILVTHLFGHMTAELKYNLSMPRLTSLMVTLCHFARKETRGAVP